MLGTIDADVSEVHVAQPGTWETPQYSIPFRYTRENGELSERTSHNGISDIEMQFFQETFEAVAHSREEVRFVQEGTDAYDEGRMGDALEILTAAVRKQPRLHRVFFFHLRVATRICAVHDADLRKYWHLSPLKRFISRKPTIAWRCKWCGEQTAYVSPNAPTFGFGVGNNCDQCNGEYPIPHSRWDSAPGRAYSYYRGSFLSRSFYEEFERDFNLEKYRGAGQQGVMRGD